MPVIRDQRTTLAILITVLLFIWCIGAASSDNRRWVKNLHEGHQSATFRRALGMLNARQAHEERMDECSVCHESRNWVVNLVSTMAPVKHGVCERCHETTPAGALAAGGSPALSTNTLGLPWLGPRTGRLAHEGVDLPDKIAGLPLKTPIRIECAECHPEHQGLNSVDKVKIDTARRVRMTRVCLRCHLPSQPGRLATQVLKDFVEAHKGDNAFEPPIPEATQKAVREAPGDRPLPAATQAAAIRDILDALAKQEFFGEKDEGRRGCTPACHGEHTPTSSDADEKKYHPESAGEPKKETLRTERQWARVVRR